MWLSYKISFFTAMLPIHFPIRYLNRFLFAFLSVAMLSVNAQDAPSGDLFIVVTPENPFHSTPKVEIKPEEVMARLVKGHPRLLFTQANLADLRKRHGNDPVFLDYVNSVLKEADDLVLAEPPKGHRQTLTRLLRLGFAYQWTGKTDYVAPAVRDLLAVCEEPEWDWVHFLGAAESAMTVGLGYDWFYDQLDEPKRRKIRLALIGKGLVPGVAAYAGAPYGWFRYVRHNWNLVCNSGLLIGALAIAETDPDYAKIIVPAALASLPLALNEYALDGAYPEGPGYSGFATQGALFGITSLQSALGTDFGLSEITGFSKNMHYRLHVNGPSGLDVAYADASPKKRRFPDWGFFWMSGRYNDPLLAQSEHDFLRESKRKPSPLHVLFYQPAPTTRPEPLPLDKYFRGPVEFVAMRASWTDRNAVYAGLKAGYNQVNHGHLDLGNFEIDALGERWFYDIGGDNYGLPGYFDMADQRWTYYRNATASHNVPMIAGKNQNINGISRIRAHSLNTGEPFAIVDLSNAYAGQAARVERGVRLVNQRSSIIVQDEFEFTSPQTLSWGAMTQAEIVLNGAQADLIQNGKRLRVTLLSPKGVFKEVSTRQEPPQKTNEGIRRLAVDLQAGAGRTTLVIQLTPITEGVPATPARVRPLAEWLSAVGEP